MICWKCKHDMPDGLKYCGHCGVRMNRVLYALEWLFSRKGLPVLLTLLALIIGGLALWLIPKFTVPAININFDLDMGLYQPSDDDIVYSDDEKSYGYVSNMMLIFFTRDATPEQIGQIVAEINGEVVGIMPGVNQYQVKVTTRTEEELEELRKQLMTYDVVKNAVIDYVSTVEGESIPNDPWPDPEGWFSNSNWDESAPYGSNWWAEAVKLPSAWEYRDYFTNIKVGITDTGFDTAHEDLSISVLNAHLNNADRHGTHVAGIIGATHNNGLGISGVLENASLYGVDCFATEAQEAQRIALSSMIGGIDLCLNEGCRVVNMSVGLKLEYAQKHPDAVRSVARNTVENLVMMLDYAQEDFIICQSAGNSSLDAHDFNGYFCSIDRAMVQEVLDQMHTDGVKLEKDITVDDVMNCFLVVGAVDYPDQDYQLADFSNYGPSITVCAPGVHILSTVPGEYGFKNGTSMAAPVVTGVAAMVWSVDPAMSAAQVKEILISTATETVLPVNTGDDGSYYLLDAQAAVEKAVGVLESKPDPTYYAFWDYENSTSVPTTVSTYQDITGVACARSSYNWEFLSGNYENVVDGYDPNLGVFLYDYDQASLDTYKAYLESIGFSFYLEKEYSQGTSCFYRYGNSYYMDLFVSEDGSQLAVEPFMNADPAGSPEDPTEPPEDPTEPSQDPTTPSDPHPYYRVWDYASQSFVESQISEYSHITGFDCVFSAENWAFLQEGFGNTTAGYDRNLRVFLYQYDWRYFYAYTDHLRLKGWTYRMDETDQGTYYYYEHPEDGFHMDIFIFQDGSYLAVEPYMNKSGSSASAYYLFWDYANQEFAASDVIAYHNFTGAECVFSTSNWKFLEDYTFELVEGYDPTQCIFIHAYDADLLAEYEDYLEEAGFTSYLVEEYTQGTSHYYRHAASGFYLDLFVSTDRRSLAVSPFLNADPAADTDPDEPPQDYSWNQCYKFWDYKDQVFVQSAMATYQAVTGSECLYSSPDWSFLHEDYSQVSEGYQDTLGVFLHAYDAASMNAYTAYLESRGFTSYLVEKYAQGTSYYYEHPEWGYFVDIFVTKDGSYIVIEPYMNADPA